MIARIVRDVHLTGRNRWEGIEEKGQMGWDRKEGRWDGIEVKGKMGRKDKKV